MVTITYAVCLFALMAVKAYAADVNPDDFLEKYGYLDSLGKRSGSPHQRQLAKTRAIKAFQEFAHIPVTGELDEKTKEKMIAPRCGMTDVPRNKFNRASYTSKWNKDTITWKLVKTSKNSPLDTGKVRKNIKDAFAVWAKIIPLTFVEVNANEKSDMQFDFGTKDHGDGYHFDGQGSVLAHAFFPSDGRLHFDDDEMWTFENATEIRNGQHTDLLSVTIHEMGHALGLPHLKEEDAIMFPYYRHPDLDSKGQIKPFVLSQYDIRAMQEAYGPREGATQRPVTQPPTPEPTPPGGPSQGTPCPKFQAAVTGADGATYFFNGNSGWKKTNFERDSASSATRFYLNNRFPNGPSSVTAAVTDKGAQRTFLLQGRRVWGYSWRSSDGQFSLETGTGEAKGFPKDLQADVPFTPEGAFQLNGGHLILYAGDKFVIWDPTSNQGSFLNSLSGYFGNFPSKTSFEVEGRLYFINNDQLIAFDTNTKNEISRRPLKVSLTC